MNYITLDMKARIEAKLKQCIAIAENRYKITIPFPTVRYDLRGTTAGMAYYSQWMVKFNAILLIENFEEFLEDTVPHEIAHLITEKVYPEAHRRAWGGKSSPHGDQWKSVMRVLGADPSRCHSYDVTNARVRETASYEYQCQCCGEILKMGPKRHAKEQMMPGFYTHTSCGRARGKLVLVGSKAPVATVHVKPMSTSATPKMPAPAPKTAPEAGSKLSKCYGIYKQHPTLSRKDMIQMFVMMAGCTAAGASTYHATCKKMYEGGVR